MRGCIFQYGCLYRREYLHPFPTESWPHLDGAVSREGILPAQSAVVHGILGKWDVTLRFGRLRHGHFSGEALPAPILAIDFISAYESTRRNQTRRNSCRGYIVSSSYISNCWRNMYLLLERKKEREARTLGTISSQKRQCFSAKRKEN